MSSYYGKTSTKNKFLASNKYIDLKVHFNNILKKLLLQWKMKEDICKFYFIA